MKKVVLIGFILLIGVAGLAFVLMPNDTEQRDNDTAATQTSPRTEATQSEAPAVETVTVTHDENGFSPSAVTITKGSTVNFVNNWVDMPMWVASDPHPEHTSYPELDTSAELQSEIPPGNKSYSFTFEKSGTWGYHNHSAPEHTATIIVQ